MTDIITPIKHTLFTVYFNFPEYAQQSALNYAYPQYYWYGCSLETDRKGLRRWAPWPWGPTSYSMTSDVCMYVCMYGSINYLCTYVCMHVSMVCTLTTPAIIFIICNFGLVSICQKSTYVYIYMYVLYVCMYAWIFILRTCVHKYIHTAAKRSSRPIHLLQLYHQL